MYTDNRGAISKKIITAVAVGCTFLVLLLVGLTMYAVWQKRRAERAIGLSKPFGIILFLPACSAVKTITMDY